MKDFGLSPEHLGSLHAGHALFFRGILGEAGASRCLEALHTLRPRLRPALVGKRGESRLDPETRGDQVTFLLPGEVQPGMERLLAWYATLGRALTASTGQDLSGFELQVSCYGPGAQYTRHVDVGSEDHPRRFTAIYYPQLGRTDAGGGKLRLYTPDGLRDLVPGNDTAALFRADIVPHAVLPTREERWAVTAWFRRRVSRG